MTTTTTPDQTQVTNLPPTQPVSGTVNVGNLPPTQPISAASLPLPTGAATEASLGTDGATPPSIPGTGIRGWLRSIYDKLSGTLTTDVSDRSTRALGHVVVDSGSVVATGPLTDAQLRASAVPVSGTFFQATQPVSGTVTANAGTGVFDVTPVAPAATDYLPVRLTDGAAFYSATGGTGGGGGAVTVADGADVAQGVTTDAAWVSGAGTTIGLLKAVVNAIKGTLTVATHAVTQSGTWTQDVTDRAARLLGHVTVDNGSLPVTGTFWQTTQPVSGTFWQATQPVSGTVAADLNAGTNRIGSVRPVDSSDADLTSAKGTQTTSFVGVQQAHDAGRQQVLVAWEEMAGTAAVESSLTNFTMAYRAVGAVTAANHYTVSAGKTLRIQSIHVYVKSTSTVAILARLRIRQGTTVANSSSVIWGAVIGMESPTFASGEAEAQTYPIPEGLEVAGSQQITFTWFTSASSCTVGMVIVGYEY